MSPFTIHEMLAMLTFWMTATTLTTTTGVFAALEQVVHLQQEQQLDTTMIMTTVCPNVRTTPFLAKLELEYVYLLETSNGPFLDLTGMQRALVRAMTDSLFDCQERTGEPLFALDHKAPQSHIEQGFCIPRDPENTCSVIRGRTIIYLDGHVNDARDAAYNAIYSALDDPSYLVLFAPNIVRARFLNSTQENLILMAEALADSDSSGSDGSGGNNSNTAVATSAIYVAISIAAVIFVVTGIFTYGFFRRQIKLNAEKEAATAAAIAAQERKTKRKKKRNRLQYFTPLEASDDDDDDDRRDHHLALQITTDDLNDDDDDARSISWSVSDITSDSASVQSILSRSPSTRLEKIEEEGDIDLEEGIEIRKKRKRSAGEKKSKTPSSFSSTTTTTMDYTVAYAAHKSRLQSIMDQACVNDHSPVVMVTSTTKTNSTNTNTPTSTTTDGSVPSYFTFSPDSVNPVATLKDMKVVDGPFHVLHANDGERHNTSDGSGVERYHTPESSETTHAAGVPTTNTADACVPNPDKLNSSSSEIDDDDDVDSTLLDPMNTSHDTLGMILDISNEGSTSESRLTKWLIRLLQDLQKSQRVKRIESPLSAATWN